MVMTDQLEVKHGGPGHDESGIQSAQRSALSRGALVHTCAGGSSAVLGGVFTCPF
jgi:hypothetical protein